MTATTEDSSCQENFEEAAANAGTSGRTDWLAKKKVLPLWIWICLLLLTVALIVAACTGYFLTHKSPLKAYLDEYEEIAFYELSRPLPYLRVARVDKEDCAKNCSTDVEFKCQHVQFCADEGDDLGVCDFFAGNDSALRAVLSENCSILTRGDPALFHIPHGGASPLDRGSFQALTWAMLTLPVFKFFVC